MMQGDTGNGWAPVAPELGLPHVKWFVTKLHIECGWLQMTLELLYLPEVVVTLANYA
jgi:hypothetical protein